jgi:hypothetical protein
MMTHCNENADDVAIHHGDGDDGAVHHGDGDDGGDDGDDAPSNDLCYTVYAPSSNRDVVQISIAAEGQEDT